MSKSQAAYPTPEYADYDFDTHQVRLLLHDPTALAFEWIKRYAKGLGGTSGYADDDDEPIYSSVSAQELIETALSNLNPSSRYGDYISKGDLLEDVYTDPVFWDKLAIMYNLEIPKEKRNNFFSCAC